MTMTPIESPLRIEPCGLEEDVDQKLVRLVEELRAAAARLGAGMDRDRLDAFRRQVRLANARASNRIEGIDATADEIAAALNGQPVPARRRAAAQAGAAHVEVETWIDGLAASGALPSPTSAAFIAEIHARLYRAMPEELAMAGAARVMPGALRGPGEDVAVGRHLPPSGGRVEAFLEHFERRYRGLTSGPLGRILAIPAAHHRLAYIHPFIDGNGRVGRLMSHAMLHQAGLYGHGLWSISFALTAGEGVEGYLRRMEAADSPRRGDRDGRGNLSQAALKSFTAWFLGAMREEIGAIGTAHAAMAGPGG